MLSSKVSQSCGLSAIRAGWKLVAGPLRGWWAPKDRGELISDPIGQGNDDIGLGSVMAHLLQTLGNFPGLRAAAMGRGPQVCRAGANDDVLSPRLQPKTGASPATVLLGSSEYKVQEQFTFTKFGINR